MTEISSLDMVLLAYRETFGSKTERAKEIYGEACVEVARLKRVVEAARKLVPFVYEQSMEGETEWEHAVLTLLAKLAELDAPK